MDYLGMYRSVESIDPFHNDFFNDFFTTRVSANTNAHVTTVHTKPCSLIGVSRLSFVPLTRRKAQTSGGTRRDR